MLAAGVSLKVVSDGSATPASPSPPTYTHVVPAVAQDEADRIADLVAGARETPTDPDGTILPDDSAASPDRKSVV